jgi:hypothetical protein
LYFYQTIIFSFNQAPMLQRTSIAEIVFWLLFLAKATNYTNIHFSYFILPGLIVTVESLLNNYSKNKQND